MSPVSKTTQPLAPGVTISKCDRLISVSWYCCLRPCRVLPVVGKLHLLLLVVVLLLPNGACVYVRSRAGVVGTYQLVSDHRRIVLELSSDGNFSEMIDTGKGEVTKHVGRWDFKPGNYDVTFDSLWIPKEFAPDYILRTDQNSKGQPKFTEPGSWILTPTYEWGTVTLDVFPDDNISFKKPTPSKFLFVLISLLVIGYGGLQCFAPHQLAKLRSRLRRSANTPRIERDGFFDRFAGFVIIAVGAYILLATLAL